MLLVEQHDGVLLGEGEAPLVGGRGDVVDGEHAGGRLLLDPLAGVAARRSPRPRRAPAAVPRGAAQGLVEPEQAAEVDEAQLHGGQAGAEELLGEGAHGLLVDGELVVGSVTVIGSSGWVG